MNASIRLAAAASAMLFQTTSFSATVLSENFESSILDSRISISTTGTFLSAPGVKSMSLIEGSKAFGFGLSTNRFNSYNNYATNLTITFPSPVYVTNVSFDEMELFGNWGSGGDVYADGISLAPSPSFGHMPYNTGGADSTFRSHTYAVNKLTSQLVLRVHDITDLSEIYIDRLSVSAVPEPATSALLTFGAGLVVWGARRKKSQQRDTLAVAG